MLVNSHCESLPVIATKLVPYGEHQEPLTESNGVCMTPWLYITMPKTESKKCALNIKLKKLKNKSIFVQQNCKLLRFKKKE